ncbi:protease inhibitor Inh/omp19 family protein [Sinorhizobium numidicum]|uniref:Outer membrane lipoprotein omp19 n=1 Tax=Sinorhizobium numidicum TaxID=680248 RepID=A0ABY8D2W1_9HYPH|nr:protease inhibitor Inh/omp19 family protein [Sinorhizobium numidicum]WEX77216.1 protease inhibitor Inh/omp19 family protein [Sinorhizobium numidicum]WEX83875.1 protease inhibitor Inh/omp19 family protein [Sinorhizobium numidicum]
MRVLHAAAGLAVVLALTGCQRTSMGGFGSQDVSPAPLQAQPVPTVSSSQLPDPTTNTSQFPTAPTSGTATPGGTQPGTQVAAATNALDVTKESMVGNWRVSSAGSSCDMFLTLTNLGSGSRGGTRGCAGELTAMGSWEVAGKQVVLKDRNGNAIARLYKTADARFDGSTNGGQPVSLSR